MKTPVKSRDEIEALLKSISYTPVEIFINLLNESNDFIRFDYFNDTVFANGVLEKSLNYLNIINLLHDLSEDNESRNIFLCIKFMHKKLCDIFREKGFNENVVLYLAFKICNYEMTIYENKIVEILEIKDYGLFDENQIELFKTKLKLARSLIKVRYDMDISFDKDLKVLEAMELTNQVSKLNNQISEATNDAEIVQNEIPSITTGTSPDDEIELPEFNIETKEIFESGFVRAFIEEYYEEKIHSYYPDKDKLLYVMCSTDAEKHEVTKKQIEFTKNEINKLGWKDLSFGYLLSCKQDSGPNFIKVDDRFIFWVKRFTEEFIDNTDTFFLVSDTIANLSDNLELKKKLSAENSEFWELIDKKRRPKNQNFMLEDLIELEIDLVNKIEYDIEEYKVNKSWEFDFEEYEKYIETNKAIEDLFNISELLVQLNRLDMFQSFLLPSSLSDIITLINNAFFKLESFMSGTLKEYYYFGFNDTFSQLFIEAKRNENYTYETCNLITQYWSLCSQISDDFDKSDFDNDAAYENEDFCNDCSEIENLYWNRMEEFEYFFPSDLLNQQEIKISITDILKNKAIPPQPIKNKNLPKKEISLSDFLIKKSDLEKLIQIQNDFIHYEGKRMAILIYFLQVKYKIIFTISNSKTHSRKQFIQLFKNDSSFNKFQAMNKYLDPYSGELNLSTNNDLDADYIDIKEKLTKIIENPVV